MKRLLFFIFLIFFAGFGYKVYGSFSKSIWDGKNRVNLVLVNEEVSVFSLNPSEQTAVFMPIPPQTFIEVIHGYGFYRIDVVFKLGELENHQGGELLAESIQENLGIPVDAYASISNLVPPAEPLATHGKTQNANLKSKDFILATFGDLLKNSKTNLTKWDLVRLWWQLKKIRQDKIAVVELEKMDVLKEIVLADETKGFQIDSGKMEKITQEFFKDQKIRQEDLSIAVLNSTTHSGLADKGARLVRNISGRVVEIGVGGQDSKCEVKSLKRVKKSYTVKKLMKIFDCRWAGEELGVSRSEVVLILGEDYWEKLGKMVK